ncbi:DUF2987 domain-containing protein [Paraneptunicella aestuarii]|uniref:DUF2987 domain-containing protein n=1 Tax=Paraneptunicella aestuarii TaxID=2831148 RepID=UPI001E307DC7|nr:DUF2987 domain-containing protein [Paraneptunicella aestuarii]UAA37117.1 DUF2987 domain-containing protein [Paraneptunicella aestuarii]
MTKFKWSLLVLITLVFSFPILAVPEKSSENPDQLIFSYSDFYSHLRKLDTEELDALQFAFGFAQHQSKKPCAIKNVFIHTQKQDIPVTVDTLQRFTLPKEKALKLANATVNVQFSPNQGDCDMSVLILAKPNWETQISSEQLNKIDGQFRTFFKEVGSFLSFLMPETKGIQLHYDMASSVPNLNNATKQDKRLLLSKDWLGANTEAVELTPGFEYISAWVD